jgi:hypothetical protein
MKLIQNYDVTSHNILASKPGHLAAHCKVTISQQAAARRLWCCSYAKTGWAIMQLSGNFDKGVAIGLAEVDRQKSNQLACLFSGNLLVYLTSSGVSVLGSVLLIPSFCRRRSMIGAKWRCPCNHKVLLHID